jgi:hypothetical protein
MELAPRHKGEGGTQGWKISRQVEGQPLFTTELSGPPPWFITVPLEPGQTNRIELTADPAPPADPLPPFTVRGISVKNARE